MSSNSGSSGSEDEENTAPQEITGANADPTILSYFWDLASLQQEERQTAAEALVDALVSSQKQYDAEHRPAGSQPPGNLEQQQLLQAGSRQQRMEQALQCCSPHMAYGLKRLARGLASSRQGARQGFAAALAATLAHSAAAAASRDSSKQQAAQLQQPFVSAAGVLSLLDACLEVTGSMKGSDQRDTLLGRVFGLAALARSGLVTAYPAAAAAPTTAAAGGRNDDVDSGSSLALACVAAVADQVVSLLLRKSFLRESAAASLVELLQQLGVEQMQQVLAQAPKLAALLQQPVGSAPPEVLLLALRLWHNLPPQTLQHCQLLPQLPASQQPPPELFWQQPGAVQRGSVTAAAAAVFAAGHVQQLVPVLLTTSASHPRLHPVWGCLLALLVPGFSPIKVTQAVSEDQQQQQQRAAPDLQQLTNLWQHFVEGACFSSSHERKALALQLLQLLLPVITPAAVPVVLSRQLLNCLDTALRDRGSYLHASAKKCLDRLNSCAEHSLVVRGDAAQAAKLRMALAAALQAHPRLQAAAGGTSGNKGAAQQQLLQGLDAAGVAVYVDQLLGEFVTVVAGQKGAAAAAAAANGSAAAGEGDGASSSEDEDEEAGQMAGPDDTKARQLLDQLSAALRFPSANSSILRRGLSFLAAAAFLRLPGGLDPAQLGSLLTSPDAMTPTDGTDGTDGSTKRGKKKSKKGQQEGGACEVAAGAAAPGQQQQQVLQMEQQVLQLAASMQHGPSQQLRQHCAARLISLLHSLQHRAAAAAATPSSQQQQDDSKQQDGNKQQPGTAESKKQKKKAQAEREQAAAAAAKQAAWQQQEAVTTQLLQFVAAAVQLPGVESTADEDVLEMVQQLQQLEAAISKHAAGIAQQGGEQQQQQQSAAASRFRTGLQLVHQLQLQLLSGGLTAEAAGSVVDDLEVALVRGLGMPTKGLGIDKAAAAAALRKGGSSSEGEEDEAGAGGSSSSSEDDEDDEDEDGAPAWQDVLLDLLISLLSSSSSEGAAGAGGGGRGAAVAVPSAPLREACEGVFRVFAEDMTAQGLSDLLRILTQRPSEILKQQDEDEEDEEMEVDESDEGDGQSDDGSEAADEEEEEEEEEEADKEKQAAVEGEQSEDEQAAADSDDAGGADEDADAGSEGGEASDLDDEAMMRLDAQLGAAVRSMINRGGGSAKERAASLLALQLRVAALLEEWLKKCPRSPLVLQVVLPLLKALVAARGAGGSPTLADRLTGLVTKHLSRCRPVLLNSTSASAPGAAADDSDDVEGDKQQQAAAAAAAGASTELQSLAADVRKVLYYASRDKDPRVAAAAGQALLVLLGAAAEAGGGAAAVAQEAAAAALTDFFEKKKSRLQKPWCEQLLSRCSDVVVGGDAAGLRVLLSACSKARNDSVRGKAVQLLPVLLRSAQQQQAAALLAVLRQQQAAVAAALGAAVTGPYKSKDQHAAAVKAVVQLLLAVQKAAGSDKRLAELLGPEAVRELGKAAVVVKAAGVAPRVETQLDRLVNVARLQQLVASGKPDPARLALLRKSRAALEDKAAAGKADSAPNKQQQKQQQQQQQQKKQKQKQQEEEQEDGGVAMEVDSDEEEAGEAGSGRQQQQQHKQRKQKKSSKTAAGDQQQGGLASKPDKEKKKKKQEKQQTETAGGGGAGATPGKRKQDKGSAEHGKKQKKHKQ